MEAYTTRRTFLGGAAMLAVWPQDLFGDIADAKTGGNGAFPWERPDGSATDSVMVRRLYLDLAGRIPTKDEAQAYDDSADPGKRTALAERLLDSKDFADYWAMRFCDILRVKSEFPINLWPNAVYSYHARIRTFVERNEPWDLFGRALLTAQGSDFRDAEANFFRATDRRSPEGWAEATAQTFLGIPPARLSYACREELARYFANVKIKTTREWKEEIVYVDGADRRAELCDWLFGTERNEVAASFRRRIRSWIFGPSDVPTDAPGDDGMRLKDVLRGIVLSDEYARGSVTGGFPARRLDAEVLDDAFCTLGGATRNYQSPAPEPFTFLPPERATVCIEDGSISSGFLTLFGRPARDTGLMDERGQDVTAKQRMLLFNSARLHRLLNNIATPPGKMKDGSPNPLYRLSFEQRIDDLYWKFLSRAATPGEKQTIKGAIDATARGKKLGMQKNAMLRDVAWCLANSKEFIFRI